MKYLFVTLLFSLYINLTFAQRFGYIDSNVILEQDADYKKAQQKSKI